MPLERVVVEMSVKSLYLYGIPLRDATRVTERRLTGIAFMIVFHELGEAKEPNVTTQKRRPGQMVGYLRVSALAQKELRQLDGITVEKRFTDKVSGKDMHRPQLLLLLEYVRDGDTVVCMRWTGWPATWMTSEGSYLV